MRKLNSGEFVIASSIMMLIIAGLLVNAIRTLNIENPIIKIILIIIGISTGCLLSSHLMKHFVEARC